MHTGTRTDISKGQCLVWADEERVDCRRREGKVHADRTGITLDERNIQGGVVLVVYGIPPCTIIPENSGDLATGSARQAGIMDVKRVA